MEIAGKIADLILEHIKNLPKKEQHKQINRFIKNLHRNHKIKKVMEK